METFIFLFLIQLKHWFVDFRLQTNEMVISKGIYGDKLGMLHSMQHAVGTFIAAVIFTNIWLALFVAVFDFVTHYHIDWTKMNHGNRDITTKQFWSDLGLDQMAHQVVYILIFLMIL